MSYEVALTTLGAMVRGTDYNLTVTIYDDNGDPFNLDGCTVELQLTHYSYIDDTAVLSIEGEIIDADLGKVLFSFTPEDTASLEAKAYDMRVVLNTLTGKTYIPVRGRFGILSA